MGMSDLQFQAFLGVIVDDLVEIETNLETTDTTKKEILQEEAMKKLKKLITKLEKSAEK
jgi:cob(I)alamin adenosyltransferase